MKPFRSLLLAAFFLIAAIFPVACSPASVAAATSSPPSLAADEFVLQFPGDSIVLGQSYSPAASVECFALAGALTEAVWLEARTGPKRTPVREAFAWEVSPFERFGTTERATSPPGRHV